MTDLTLFKGTFNWYGVNHEFYTHAKDRDRAFRNFCNVMAEEFLTSRQRVANYFLGNENYFIEKLEKEK